MENPKIILNPDFDLEERVQRARDNFRIHGYNCCQSMLLAYADVIGIDPQTAAVLTSGFGGGMGRLREVCGSVSAMFMIAGYISPAADPSVKSDRTANYAIVQEVARKFREENGSIVCKELLGLVPKGTAGKSGPGVPAQTGSEGKSAIFKPESPEPSDRTAEYYRKRPCEKLIECSARIIGEKLREAAMKQTSASLSDEE